MSYSKILPLVVVVSAVCLAASTAEAQRRGGGRPSGRSGVVVGHATPRPFIGSRTFGPRFISPRFGVLPYRRFYYPYRPGLTIGFYGAFGYPYYYPYGYYGYGYGYGYPYAYGPYGYGYGYGAVPPAYLDAQPGVAYGGVRIQGAPPDAQVFADGYYVGVADDFDGPVHHLNLPAGAHRIEIRAPGLPPIAFDVNVLAGQTITYHANVR